MNKYIAQPYYGDPSASPPVQPAVKIYSLADASLVTTISFGSRGPNCVVLYQDSGNVYYLFVSFDFGATGAVEVYEFPSINDLTNAASLPIPTTISFPDSVAGMAVHPGTGDLYVAAFSNGDGNGGVFHCPKGPTGYAASSLFSSNADPSVTFVCANLAFDFHGNLWMTTFDAAGGQFLICYTRVSLADKSKFFKITNGQAFSTLTNLPGSAPAPGAMLPFSAPEGIAFDPAGNLWVANNNDVSDFFATNGAGNGTLLRISKVWIDTNLLNYVNLYGAPGFGMAFPFVKDDPSVAVYYLNNAEFGGLLFDGFTLYANDQGNGKVWRWDVTPDPATHLPNPLNFQTSGISTTYPGNGTMAIFDTTPASLLMKDGALDAGIEPDPAIGFGVFGPVWESVDIAVTVTPQLDPQPGGVLPNGDHAPAGISLTSTPTVSAGKTYVQVRVTNLGTVTTTGREVLKLYWAKASAALDWPAPWDGLKFDSGSHPPMGGFIDAQELGPIRAGYEKFFEFVWTAPDSAQYSIDDGHFCLLARIEMSSLYPFGMTFREQANAADGTDIINNATNNSKIAWRNVHIVSSTGHGIHFPVPGLPIRLGVLGANYSLVERNVRFAVQMVGRDGRPAQLKGQLVVHVEGPSLLRLLETKFEEHIFHFIGEGRFRLHDPVRGIENVRLRAGETLPFHVEFTPEEDMNDFAIRVVQYVYSNGVAKVAGGQTFVVGKVEGLSTRQASRETERIDVR